MAVSLAECEEIQAFEFLGRLFISADGHQPTSCHVVKIVVSPILIFPPQYEVQWEQTKPCVELVTPFHMVGGPFPLPPGEKTVKLATFATASRSPIPCRSLSHGNGRLLARAAGCRVLFRRPLVGRPDRRRHRHRFFRRIQSIICRSRSLRTTMSWCELR
jgi:hypothetical protein